jgi:hypothetical protein
MDITKGSRATVRILSDRVHFEIKCLALLPVLLGLERRHRGNLSVLRAAIAFSSRERRAY